MSLPLTTQHPRFAASAPTPIVRSRMSLRQLSFAAVAACTLVALAAPAAQAGTASVSGKRCAC